MEKILGIILLLIGIILSYMFLFWIVKQVSSVIYEYDHADKESKRGIFLGFVLYSIFIIAPSYGIITMIAKIFELI